MSVKPFLIGDRWITGRETTGVRNPFSGTDIATVAVAGTDHIEAALDAAEDAFARTGDAAAGERAEILERIAEGIRSRADAFVEGLIAEAGKPRKAAEVETERAQYTFRFAAQETLRSKGELLTMDASPPGKGHTGIVERFPLGIILGITPFNFPLNLVAHKVAPCIATGNVMILKPALKTPLSALLLGEVLLEAGMPPGQVNIVPFHHDHIDKLLGDDRIKMLTFTGSDRVGWNLKSRAGKCRVALELGGNAAVMVHDDADLEDAIPLIAAGAFGFAGQSCISVQRIFVQDRVYARFKERFVQRVRDKIRTGDPSSPEVTVGPIIDDVARDRIVEWLKEADAAGAHFLMPLKVEGNCIHPVILEKVPDTARVSCEEVFGPVALLEPYEDFDDGLRRVNASRFGLQAGVFTAREDLARRAFERLEVGGVMINQAPTFRVENMPYGGVKDSGVGREGLRYAMEEMTELRSLIIRHP